MNKIRGGGKEFFLWYNKNQNTLQIEGGKDWRRTEEREKETNHTKIRLLVVYAENKLQFQSIQIQDTSPYCIIERKDDGKLKHHN